MEGTGVGEEEEYGGLEKRRRQPEKANSAKVQTRRRDYGPPLSSHLRQVGRGYSAVLLYPENWTGDNGLLNEDTDSGTGPGNDPHHLRLNASGAVRSIN